jgi:hypothetical protein
LAVLFYCILTALVCRGYWHNSRRQQVSFKHQLL